MRSFAGPVAIGGICGLAWAAGLRGFMAQVAMESHVSWYGTFVQILLPGIVTGMLLGWAEYIRRTGGRRRWRWLSLAPLAFPIFIVASPEVIGDLFKGQFPFTGGIGGGALALPLFGMAGGYALSGRGPKWARALASLLALASIPAWALSASQVNSDLALTTPRGAWVALLFWSAIATLAIGCAIPHRPLEWGGGTSAGSAGHPEGQPAADATAG